jgi:DNA-binding CsgD family transcriptional regulator
MGTITTEEERVYAEVKRLCYAGLDAPTLHRRALDCLARAVPFDGSCAHDADPVSGLGMRMHLDPPNDRSLRYFLEHVYFEDELNDFNSMIRTGRPVALLSEETGGRLERSLRYREALAPRGFHFDMRAVFASGQEHWGGVSIFRERGRHDFSDHEAALLARLSPHLAAGLRAAALLAEALPGSNIDGPGVLVLDRRGRVIQYTPSAERWLREMGDVRPDWQGGPDVPAVIWLVVGALRHALKPTTDRELISTPRITTQTRTGRWLHLQASLAETTDGRDGDMMIVIEPAGPREVAWLKIAAYGLSAREREVVECVMRGASTKQISATLFIAEDTVQDHLSHVFEKVGVRGRRALVKRLYFDSLYPAPEVESEPPSRNWSRGASEARR